MHVITAASNNRSPENISNNVNYNQASSRIPTRQNNPWLNMRSRERGKYERYTGQEFEKLRVSSPGWIFTDLLGGATVGELFPAGFQVNREHAFV